VRQSHFDLGGSIASELQRGRDRVSARIARRLPQHAGKVELVHALQWRWDDPLQGRPLRAPVWPDPRLSGCRHRRFDSMMRRSNMLQLLCLALICATMQGSAAQSSATAASVDTSIAMICKDDEREFAV